MNKLQTLVLQWARRVRDFLVEREIKSEVAELTPLRTELDDAIGQLTADAATQEAITKQSRVQTREINRLRTTIREKQIKPIVRLSRTMKLQIPNPEQTFVLPDINIDNERLAAAADAMVTALNTVGPQFVARGFAADFVDRLSTTTRALRAAIDQRAQQVSRRTGTTAAMLEHETRVIQLVRVIDTLVRPVIQNNPELLAAWDNVVALPRPSKPAGGAAAPSAGAAHPAGGTSPVVTPTTTSSAAAPSTTSTAAAA
jgi:hypothetical protein